MKTLNLDQTGVQEMDAMEVKRTDGGWIVAFIVGAIAGGALYDGWKAATKAALVASVENGEYWDGMPHGR